MRVLSNLRIGRIMAVDVQQGDHVGVESLDRLIKQVAKGGGTAFFGQGIGRVLLLLLQMLLTRVLGVGGYGVYALGYSVLGVAQALASLGLQNGVVRFGAMHHGVGDSASLKGTLVFCIGVSFTSALCGGVALFSLSYPIAVKAFGEPELALPLRLFAIALPFHTVMMVASFSARAFRRIDYEIAVHRVLWPFLTLLTSGVSFLLGYRLIGAIAGFAVSTALAAVVGLWLLYRIFPDLLSNLKARFQPKALLGYSCAALLVGLSSVLLARTDRIMLGILRSAEDVGIYNTSVTMAAQATVFLISFNTIFAPVVTDLYHRGLMEDLKRLFRTTTKWILALTLPVTLVLVLFAQPIMRLFGPGFAVGAPALIALGAAQLVNAGVGSAGQMLIMTGRQKLELVNCIAALGLNVLMNLFLIPRYGALGAGIATGTSIALVNIARLIEVYFLYNIHPYKSSCWKVLASGTLAATTWIGISRFLVLKSWQCVGGVALFAIVYLVVLVALGLDEEDRMVLRALRRQISRLMRGPG